MCSIARCAAAFAGDKLALGTARKELRSAYKTNQHVSNPDEVRQKLADADEADAFIRESIVQARRTPMGTYEVTPDQARQLQHMAPELVNASPQAGGGCCSKQQ